MVMHCLSHMPEYFPTFADYPVHGECACNKKHYSARQCTLRLHEARFGYLFRFVYAYVHADIWVHTQIWMCPD